MTNFLALYVKRFFHDTDHCVSSDALFLGCVGGMFMLFGFGAALALSRRKDPTFFAKVLSSYRYICLLNPREVISC